MATNESTLKSMSALPVAMDIVPGISETFILKQGK